jgi:hypothetical protein
MIYVKAKQLILTAKSMLLADPVMERIEILARRNHNLEARVDALEIIVKKLLQKSKEWV